MHHYRHWTRRFFVDYLPHRRLVNSVKSAFKYVTLWLRICWPLNYQQTTTNSKVEDKISVTEDCKVCGFYGVLYLSIDMLWLRQLVVGYVTRISAQHGSNYPAVYLCNARRNVKENITRLIYYVRQRVVNSWKLMTHHLLVH